MSITLFSRFSIDQTWLPRPLRFTRMAGSLTKALRCRGLAAGICRVTLNSVFLPISSERKLASRTRALARTMSSRNLARLFLNSSSIGRATRRSMREATLGLGSPEEALAPRGSKGEYGA
ncbi:unnamed protein product [Ixodes pacificus]